MEEQAEKNFNKKSALKITKTVIPRYDMVEIPLNTSIFARCNSCNLENFCFKLLRSSNILTFTLRACALISAQCITYTVCLHINRFFSSIYLIGYKLSTAGRLGKTCTNFTS